MLLRLSPGSSFEIAMCLGCTTFIAPALVYLPSTGWARTLLMFSAPFGSPLTSQGAPFLLPALCSILVDIWPFVGIVWQHVVIASR